MSNFRIFVQTVLNQIEHIFEKYAVLRFLNESTTILVIIGTRLEANSEWNLKLLLVLYYAN